MGDITGSGFNFKNNNGLFKTAVCENLISNQIALPITTTSPEDLQTFLQSISGAVLGVTNLGGGEGIFAQINAGVAEFKSLSAGNNTLTISSTATEVQLIKTGPLAEKVIAVRFSAAFPPVFTTDEEAIVHGNAADVADTHNPAGSTLTGFNNAVLVITPTNSGTYIFHHISEESGLATYIFLNASGQAQDNGAVTRTTSTELLVPITVPSADEFAYFDYGARTFAGALQNNTTFHALIKMIRLT